MRQAGYSSAGRSLLQRHRLGRVGQAKHLPSPTTTREAPGEEASLQFPNNPIGLSEKLTADVTDEPW